MRSIKAARVGPRHDASMSDDIAISRRRVDALRASLAAQTGRPVRLVETHISWVLLTETQAFKLKKPVCLPFLDFSTAAARRHCCEEELRLNRRLAPSIYLDVVEVRDSPSGPVLGGAGPVADFAVHMRRFPDGALWSERLAMGRLGPAHIDAMAQCLHDFHQAAAIAPPESPFGGAAAHDRVTRRLIDGLASCRASAAADGPVLRDWLTRQLHALAPLWEQRRRAGRVREGHGDLHLANVLQLGEAPAAFDGIEFDDELRWIDVLYDIAFLAMDLLAHGQRALAFRFVNAYLEASGDYDGLPALRFYLVSRALVRAQVAAIAEEQGGPSAGGPGATGYLALAAELIRSADPRLAITHGLPGAGKSHLSQRVIEAAGAIRVRSDVERKRLFGLPALAHSGGLARPRAGGIYDAETTRRTYARLDEAARAALAGGWPCVIDAAFLRGAERGHVAALAWVLEVPFSIFDCRARLVLLRQRLQQRQAQGHDASEADVAVLERLRQAAEPLDDDELAVSIVVDAAEPLPSDVLAQRWLAAVPRPALSI